MPKIIGTTQTDSYPVHIGISLNFAELLKDVLVNDVLVVADNIVAPLYLNYLQNNLQKFTLKTLVLAAGETTKNFDTVLQIIAKLSEYKFDRNSVIISLGGGVIGDMTGFAAAIYMRGINWVQIPTTLMAQVDSSIGGKTGCNHAGIKNLIGVFYQPKAVIIDTNYLSTLPEREYISGLAEIVKYGIAIDKDFFLWL
jgi:3-dehydroquinate synthase